MIYGNLLLNKDNFDKLCSFYNASKLPNAFIFHGPAGVGKEAHAIEFAALINCSNIYENNSCGNCNSCKKIKKIQHENLEIIIPYPKSKALNIKDHPLKALNTKQLDLLKNKLLDKGLNPYSELKIESANTIIINSIRQIKKNISLSINLKTTKLFLIFEAEKLCLKNNESGNALLKILEEPPPDNLFILITSDISKIIDTIKSRCLSIYFPQISSHKIVDYLINQGVDTEQANTISYISEGSLKNAINLIRNYKIIIKSISVFINIIFHKANKNFSEIISNFKNKNELLNLLNYLIIFFSDLLLIQNNITKIKFIEYKDIIIKINTNHPHVNWQSCINILNDTQRYINKNGHIPLMITAMIIELQNTLNCNYQNTNKTTNNLLDYF